MPHIFGKCSEEDTDEAECCLNAALVTPGTDFKAFPEGDSCGGDSEKGIPWCEVDCFGVTNNDTPEPPEPKKPPPPPKEEEKTADKADRTTPPDEANLIRGGKSLLNIHCATWRDKRQTKNVHEQKRFLAKCMSQDCEQSLEGTKGGCRFMDENGLCYAYNSAQLWCVDHMTNVNCHDGAEDWAIPPIGNVDGGQYATKWMPKKDAKVAGDYPSEPDYSCSCMKNCSCGRKNCRCVDKDQKGVGYNSDFDGIKIFKSSSKKGRCMCSCGGVLGF
mmetsp:Transcript_31775/g.64436  ORF Transcript_31775/g.64436 Transcript_31775/m.64436 type:complete len:274 (+) Transcript_31775:103-924(+)